MRPSENHGNGIYSDFDRNSSVSEKDFYMQNNSRDEDNGNGSGNDLTKNKHHNGNNVNVGINVDINNSVNVNYKRISNVIVSLLNIIYHTRSTSSLRSLRNIQCAAHCS